MSTSCRLMTPVPFGKPTTPPGAGTSIGWPATVIDPTAVLILEPTRLPAFCRIAAREDTSVMTSCAEGIETWSMAVRDQPLATCVPRCWSP